MPADNYSFLYVIEHGGWPGLIKDMQTNVPYLVASPLLYFIYQLFGTAPPGWIITAIIFHSLNAFLLFLMVNQLFKTLCLPGKNIPAFFAALIFLISPYQTEDVLWVAISVRWLFHACITLAGMMVFISSVPIFPFSPA